ncbi:MAG TPA: hypothetical protein VM695_02010 [Phycisphaerae bacterium]|nr:hypothetical protein [Phycisphaerae bacterium]
MASGSGDEQVLRELAKRYAEVCADPAQDCRRELWRGLNSLEAVRPVVHMRGGNCWDEVPEVTRRLCQDDFHHAYERWLRQQIFHALLGDDFVFEPWITVQAVHKCTGWGLDATRTHAAEPGGSWKADYPIKQPGDIARLRRPRHEIDEPATAERVGRVRDAVGDILPVHVDRAPAYRMWSADLSTHLGYLRGIENFMLDMMDRPAWLHELLGFMRDGVLAAHEQAEAAGDFSLAEHENQAMPYSRELADPAPNTHGARRRQLWGCMAAQEFTLVSPAMHEEFLLAYQRPILEHFGLVAYGCCEDLTRKIDLLRSLGNLRRIAVAPLANVARCAEQIGTDYVISYRPNPAEMVCCGFDAARVRRFLRRDLDVLRGLHVEITLKDVNTVENQPRRLGEWVRIARELAEEYA